jgi:sugar lactone lactonase YvrE
MSATRLTELASDLDHPEGVCWDPDGGVLYAGGELGQLYRLSLDGAVEEVARFPKFTLGLALDGDGDVVACCKDEGVWSWDGSEVTQVGYGFEFANYPAFGPDGTLYVSDSGSGWGMNDGCIRAGDEVLSREAPNFTNGLAVSPDGDWLWVAESYVPRVGRIELATGRYEEVVRIDGTVPDGLAFEYAGGVVISCYRPDQVLHLSASGTLSVVAEDQQGTVLAAPTNVCFAGPDLDRIVVANLGRWHLTVVDESGLRGVPLHRP